MHDEIGGSCPRCDGEFQRGITECPDCGIALLGLDEERPSAPARGEGGVLALPVAWAGSLTAVAGACALCVALAVAGTVAQVTSLGDRGFDAPGDVLRHQRIELLARVSSPSLGLVVLVGAVAVAVGARLRRRTALDAAAQRATFAAAAVLLALAVLGCFEDLRYQADGVTFAQQLSSLSSWVGTGVLCAVGAWLTGAFGKAEG